MNSSDTTELEPRDDPAAASLADTATPFTRLCRLYQQLGLNAAQALAAARADVVCGLTETPACCRVG